ncbi:hypothetical protein PINS_up015733 [Pythium insidiosum]|nr:hypothetical protein PINS_up015733 [Pythium insidiosum]
MALEFCWNLLDTACCPDQRLGVVSDSTFPCSRQLEGRILTPLKDGDMEKIPPRAHVGAKLMNAAILRTRQAAEWGVGSIEKVYGGLRLPLPYDPSHRDLRLENLFRLSNFRVRQVRISPILNYFHRALKTELLADAFFSCKAFSVMLSVLGSHHREKLS